MFQTFFGTIFRRVGIYKHQNEELWGDMKAMNSWIAMIFIQLNWGGCVSICFNSFLCVQKLGSPAQALNLTTCLVGRSLKILHLKKHVENETGGSTCIFSSVGECVNLKIHGSVLREAITVVLDRNIMGLSETWSSEFQHFVTFPHWDGNLGVYCIFEPTLKGTWFISGLWIFAEDTVLAYWTVPTTTTTTTTTSTTTTTTTGLPVNASEALTLGSEALILPFWLRLLGRVNL